MVSQWKIPTLFALAGGLAVAGVAPALAHDPALRAKELERKFDKTLEGASKEALDLLQRDAATARPDWVVVATANSGGWNFTLIYTKGKGLALPTPNENTPAERDVLPPLTDLVLPQKASVGLDVTSNDDIYSLEVPGLGIKANAIPGRIERKSIDTTNPGVFSSTCSEPCSAQAKASAFTMYIVDTVTFKRWLVARDAAYSAQPPGR